MKLQLNKQVIISLENLCSWYHRVVFDTDLMNAVMAQELHRLRLQAKSKLGCVSKATLDISYAQCQCLILLCDSLKDFNGPPQIVKEYVINPILKSLLEPVTQA